MSGNEWNKIFMAVLLVGLVAGLSGWIARKVVHVSPLEKNVYEVAGLPAAVTDGAAAAPAGPEPIAALLAGADLAAGQRLARACAACHSFDQGGANKVGPNLWDIVNAPHAHLEGFAYSSAMSALHDKPWDYEALNAFLYSPKAAIPGTKMVFAGIKGTQDRANLIAWLRTLSANPAPLP